MKILFIINTPAQAYTWKNIIKQLIEKGHLTKILVRDYGSAPEIMNHFGYSYSIFKTRGSKTWRLFSAFEHFQKCYVLSRDCSPSLIVGFGLDAAITGFRLRKPSIMFIDDEGTRVQNGLTHLFADIIVSPQTFKRRIGKKHILVNSYKELAYLHPEYFQPDPNIFDELKINKGDKYVILRFNAFDAVHDVGKHGFSSEDQFALVEGISKKAHVFISPEGSLPRELWRFRLPIAQTRIHHALYYAQMLVTDTQTMATEAAILGTPVIRSNNFVGPNDMGNFLELENKYELIYSFRDAHQAIKKAYALLDLPGLKEQWMKKREKLLSEKINITKLMVEIINNYPRSIENLLEGGADTL